MFVLNWTSNMLNGTICFIVTPVTGIYNEWCANIAIEKKKAEVTLKTEMFGNVTYMYSICKCVLS